MPATVRESESAAAGSTARSVALIGPNDANRRVVARALASSGIATVREFVSYPSSLSEVPRITEQRFDMLIIDVDCDESFALAIVEKIVASGKTVVMAYSQRNQPDLIKRCMQAGARDFLPLPADPDPPASDPEPAPVPSPRPRPVAAAPAAAPPIPQRRSTDLPASQTQQAVRTRPAPALPVDRPPLPPRALLDAAPSAESVQRAVPPSVPVAAPLSKPLPPLGVPPRKSLAKEPEQPELEPPIFRFAGMALPPEEPHHRSLPKWIFVVVPLGVLVGISIAFLPQLRQSLPVGVPVPWNAASNSYGPSKAPSSSGSAASPVPAVSSQPAPVQNPARSGKTPVQVSATAMDAQLSAPSRISGDLKKAAPKDDQASSFAPVVLDAGGSAEPSSAFSNQHNVRVALPPAAISAGVAAGMLIHRVEPIYPEFARKNRISGTVVLGATISRNGTLQDVHLISGPTLLREPALTAVRLWRYRPYMLNNQPVEVQTTISIVFKAAN